MSRVEIIGDARLILGDCRDVLPTLERAGAVVTDPPYGINIGSSGRIGSSRIVEVRDYGKFSWDQEAVSQELMDAVIGSAEFAVVFGGNFYRMPASSCWLVWDKLNTGDFADCELAWTNLPKAVRRIRFLWNGCMRANGETRGDHPTQKPVGVMSWVLQQLPPVRSVLDPFMGSGTTGVACALAGVPFTGIEREPRYFDAACRRLSEAIRQPRLFADERAVTPAAQTSMQFREAKLSEGID